MQHITMGENTKKIPLPMCGHYLETIYFYLTEGCNLNCIHCWIAPKFQSEKTTWPSLDFNLFKDIICQGKKLGLSTVKLAGGEPLIHPMIGEIIDYIKDANLNLSIETNAVECTPEIAVKVSKCKNPFISVSIDGADASTHEKVRGVPGCFAKAISGIRNLVKANLRPQIIMSIMRHNANQLEDVVKLAEKEGASSVKFNIIAPIGNRAEQIQRLNHTLSVEELIKLGSWVETVLAPSSKIKIFYSHPAAFKPISKIFNEPGGYCRIFDIIGVLGNGQYALCGIGTTVPNLVFGHAKIVKLANVWNNNGVLQKIRKGLPKNLKGVCKNCLVKKYCLGSCIAANYFKNSDLFAAHWYCDEAKKIGLFPKTKLIKS